MVLGSVVLTLVTTVLDWPAAVTTVLDWPAAVTTVLDWPAAVAIAGWVSAGGGMGLLYPRLSVMTLALSTKDSEDFNSSAMAISDSLGGALALAATEIVFSFTTTAASFAGVFALTAALGVTALLVAPRVASPTPGG
jgi:hypothetical protein